MRAEKPGAQPANAAENGRGKLRFPFVDSIRVLEEFDVALDDSGQWKVPPTPEFWRGGASDSRDGRRPGVLPNRDLLLLEVGERLGARLAIALAGEQVAGVAGRGFLGAADGGADPLGEFGNISPANRGDGNRLAALVNRDRFERRILRQNLRDRSRQAFGGIFENGFGFGNRGHRFGVPYPLTKGQGIQIRRPKLKGR